MTDKITPDETLITKTLGVLAGGGKPAERRKPLVRKALVAAVAVIIAIGAAMPVLASNIPSFYEVLYRISPVTAQFFMPVRAVSEDNGIRMEVISTYIHDDTAEIYVLLRDLEGNRIDETTDLYDSYMIHRPFDSSASCERVAFDPATKTATFLIRITEWGNHQIEGDKLTFSVRCFISNKNSDEGLPVDIDLLNVNDVPDIREVRKIGGGGKDFDLYFRDSTPNDRYRVLASSETVCTPAKGIDITGIGYIDDMLHIQTAVSDGLKGDNHCRLYLADGAGNIIQSNYTIAFVEYTEPDNEETRIEYNESVFDIPYKEISNYALYGDFYTSGLYTEGNWQVTFPIRVKWTGSPEGNETNGIT
jgi:hypothetical protein